MIKEKNEVLVLSKAYKLSLYNEYIFNTHASSPLCILGTILKFSLQMFSFFFLQIKVIHLPNKDPMSKS